MKDIDVYKYNIKYKMKYIYVYKMKHICMYIYTHTNKYNTMQSIQSKI